MGMVLWVEWVWLDGWGWFIEGWLVWKRALTSAPGVGLLVEFRTTVL